MNDQNLLEDQPIAWTPTPDIVERAQLTRFMKQVGVSTWDELYAYSINDVERFTEEVLKFLDIRFYPPYKKLLDTSNGVEFPTWFAAADSPQRHGDAEAETRPVGSVHLSEPGAVATGFPASSGLNITEMCLDRWLGTEVNDQRAVVWENEDGTIEEMWYRRLAIQTMRCAAGLRNRGLKKGDAIGIHLSMSAETIIALLGINRIGAIAVPVFSGYGVDAIASRLNAVGAKALFTCDGFFRRGRFYNAFDVAQQAVANSPSITDVFVVRNSTEPISDQTSGISYVEFSKLCAAGTNGLSSAGDPNPEPTSAEDPLIILYTSGTTGKPKGIAHTHASFPIKAAQDMAFGTDVGKGTRISWYTDIGWMMGPWLIYGALINGATICIYDGAPDYPTPDRMWEFCAKHKVEVLGISPTLVRSLASHESEPVGTDGETAGRRDAETQIPASPRPAISASSSPYQRHDLSSLRIFASTGEPWNPAPWWWLFEKVGNSKLPIINYSGGTEISGGILMGNPLLPIKPCSFPAPCPGMDVDILDEDGNSVPAGKVGELVIKQPWIGMARGFWQERERYLDTYWRRFKDTWVHGDWAMRDKDNHWFILGRSDDTLKIAGKRVGPSEVESLLVAHPLVNEAAVIGVPDEIKGTAMVAFCVLTGSAGILPASPLSKDVNCDHDASAESLAGRMPALQSELKALVAKDMGKPLAPSRIHFVSALPKTRNAKVMRRVIRSAYLGEDPGDLSALEHPETIDDIRDAGLQSGFLENESALGSREAFDKYLSAVPDIDPIHQDDVIS